MSVGRSVSVIRILERKRSKERFLDGSTGLWHPPGRRLPLNAVIPGTTLVPHCVLSAS